MPEVWTRSITLFNAMKNEKPNALECHKAPKLLTLEGPTPTNISKNSDPLTVMNGTLASPAVALASNVFPVPGGPDKIAP